MRKGRLIALRTDSRTTALPRANGDHWPAVEPGAYGEPVVPNMGRGRLELTVPPAPAAALRRFSVVEEGATQVAVVPSLHHEEPEHEPGRQDAAPLDVHAIVPLVRAKKLAPWLLPPQLAALAVPDADVRDSSEPQRAAAEHACVRTCCGVLCDFPWALTAAVALVASGAVLFTLHAAMARHWTAGMLAAIGTSATDRAPHWLHIFDIASVATTATASAAGAVLLLLSAARWLYVQRPEGAASPPRECRLKSVTLGAAVATSYVLSLWLVALLVATAIWLALTMVLQSGSAAASLGDSSVVDPSTCPGDACINLRPFGFIGGTGCLCDPAALVALAICAGSTRRELVYALIGELLMFLGCSAATAVLAAEFASTRVPVRRHADDAEETDLGPLKLTAGKDLPLEAGLPTVATPGTVPSAADRASRPSPPKRFYYVDEGPQGSIKSYRPDESVYGRPRRSLGDVEQGRGALAVADSPAAGSVRRHASNDSGDSGWETLRDRFLGFKMALQAGAAGLDQHPATSSDTALSILANDDIVKPLALTYHDVEPPSLNGSELQALALAESDPWPLALTHGEAETAIMNHANDGLEDVRALSYRKQLFEPAV